MRNSLPFIFVLLMAIGCKPKVPSEYIQPDEMENILYDYHLADAIAKTEPGEESTKRNLFFQRVLEKHHVTEADFDSSLIYYYSRIDRFKDIYGRVNERLNNEAKLLGSVVNNKRFLQESSNGDTVDIWSLERDLLLIPRPTNNRYEFTVKADTSFRAGDAFTFLFMAEYISQSSSKDAVAVLKATYENDSIVQITTHFTSNGFVQLHLPTNNYGVLKQLRGFIYLSNDYSISLKLLFVSQVQLMRFHQKTIIHEAESQIEKDSIPSADDSRRDSVRNASSSAGTGLRSKHAPFRRRGG